MITRYADNDGNDFSLTQDKINACLAAIEDTIDNVEEDTTEQVFGQFTWSGSYYTGMQVELDSAPIVKEPVMVQISPSYKVLVGNIYAIGDKGYFVGTIPMSQSFDISNSEYVSEETVEYVTSWQSLRPSIPETTTTTVVEDYTYSDENYSDEGTITHYTQTSYNVEVQTSVSSEPKYRLYGTKTVVKWNELQYTRTIDMNRTIDINMKYRRR